MNDYIYCNWAPRGCGQVDACHDAAGILGFGWFIEHRNLKRLSGESAPSHMLYELITKAKPSRTILPTKPRRVSKSSETLLNPRSVETIGSQLPTVLCRSWSCRKYSAFVLLLAFSLVSETLLPEAKKNDVHILLEDIVRRASRDNRFILHRSGILEHDVADNWPTTANNGR